MDQLVSLRVLCTRRVVIWSMRQPLSNMYVLHLWHSSPDANSPVTWSIDWETGDFPFQRWTHSVYSIVSRSSIITAVMYSSARPIWGENAFEKKNQFFRFQFFLLTISLLSLSQRWITGHTVNCYGSLANAATIVSRLFYICNSSIKIKMFLTPGAIRWNAILPDC